MFYASAYYELTKIPVVKLITIMVTPGGEVKVFDKRNKGDYIKLLVRYIKEFVSHNTRTENGE
jgi:genome maintenance exonuclease 1